MNNRPHSREKRVINKTVKVEKKQVNKNKSSILSSLLSKVIKK